MMPEHTHAPTTADLERLAELIRTYTPHEGTFKLTVPGVYVSRASRPSTDQMHGLHRPSLCVVAQGAKSVRLGAEFYEYDAQRMLVYWVNLPVATQITRATPDEPFLNFRLELDPYRIAELSLKMYPQGLPKVREDRGIHVSPVIPGIVTAAARLIECLAEQQDVELLAPMIVDEMLIRLLRSPVGIRVAQLGQAESSLWRISKAVEWVREHFNEPLVVEDLASLVNMGLSTFHAHFKAVTSMSPLQYQKVLRLQEARRLMLSSLMDATTASREVGYGSASQFSREYSRLFGQAPSKDVAHLRSQGSSRISAAQ